MLKKYYFLFFSTFSFLSVNAQINFVDEAASLGVNVTCGTTFLGNGVSFYDFDQDGWDDITLATEDGSKILFFKNFDGAFVEQTLNIPVLDSQTKQINWVDIDNDGDKDLFVTSNTDGNKLYENLGDLNFIDITASSGMDETVLNSYGASWGDYNNDSFLDVFISVRSANDPNVFYKNNGDNTFSNMIPELGFGIDNRPHMSFCSAFLDINNDGWQDLYVSTDRYRNSNLLYKNNGDGTFTDISLSSGTNIAIDAMSVTVDDFNNDGWQDIYITNSEEGNVFYKNNGDETFTDIATSSGTLFNSIGWGASFFDAENDMDLDLYVSGDLAFPITGYLLSAFYENIGDESFELSNESFANDDYSSFSNAIGDIDNDGYVDLVITNNFGEIVHLFENQSPRSNNWLKVNLEGTQSNRDGIGSKIEVSAGGEIQYRYTLCGEGYLAQYSGSEFFGLGPNTSIDYVKVTWLSGTEDIILDVSPNQQLHIVEGSTSLSVDETSLQGVNIFPNPFKDKLEISSDVKIEQISVYNILGQQIMNIMNNQNFDDHSLDTSSFQSGVYFVKVSTEDATETLKVIKN